MNPYDNGIHKKDLPPEKMEFWLKDFVNDYDSVRIKHQLLSIERNHNLGNPSWHPTITKKFMEFTNKMFQEHFTHKSKILWDYDKNDNEPFLTLTVRTALYGALSVNIPIEKINDENCPANLPTQLVDSFQMRFDKKAKLNE